MNGTIGNRSYCHRGGEQPLLGMTIPEHIAAIAAQFPGHEAVVSLPQQRRLSYRELAGSTLGIVGMGRIGTMAYDLLREKYGETVIGVDFDNQTVSEHCAAGRRVVYGDPTDPDFWARVVLPKREARLVLLAMPKHQANLAAARHLGEVGFPGRITAIAEFDDQVEELREAGAHAAFNVYNEAGLGFAEHACEVLEGHYKTRASS